MDTTVSLDSQFILDMAAYGKSNETVELVRYDHAVFPCELHAHRFIEIVYIEKGKGIHHIADTTYPVSFGDICIINTGIPHRFIADRGSALEVLNCLIDPVFFAREFLEKKERQSPMAIFLSAFISSKVYDSREDLKLKGKETLPVKTIMDTMHTEFFAKEPGYVQVLEGYLKVLLFLIMRTYIESRDGILNGRAHMIQSVKKYIRDNCTNELKIADIANLYFISPKYFSQLFKHHTGFTIMDYLQEVRMEEASRMLLNSDFPVRDVAYEVGYNDVTFFYELFKRKTGMTPGDYRKQHQQPD